MMIELFRTDKKRGSHPITPRKGIDESRFSGNKDTIKVSEEQAGRIIYGDLYEKNYVPDHKTVAGNLKEIHLAEKFLKQAKERLQAGQRYGISIADAEKLKNEIRIQENRMKIARQKMLNLSQS